MKVKTAIIILFSMFVLGLISLGVVIYRAKNNQLVSEVIVPQQKAETPAPIKVLTNEEKKEIGKARAAELLRMMDSADATSSTPLTEAEKAAKIKAGEARAAELLRMMK